VHIGVLWSSNEMCSHKTSSFLSLLLIDTVKWLGRIIHSLFGSCKNSCNGSHLNSRMSMVFTIDLLCHTFFDFWGCLVFIVNTAAVFPYQFSSCCNGFM
jgi:hypothetical protein